MIMPAADTEAVARGVEIVLDQVLLVSFDTLRADVAYSGRFPNIERLKKRGTTFRSAIASAPLTPPSHASVLTGLHPWGHGVRHLFRERIENNVMLVSEQFQRSGYRTGAVVSCPGLNHWYGFDRGFDHYDDEIPPLLDGSDPLKTVDVKLRGTALKRAKLVVDRAIKWLEREAANDFFLFVHFFDAHWPYEAPERPIATPNAYEDEVAFMDHHLGRLLDWLDARGSLKEMTIILFSDHGEDLGGWYANDKAGARGREEEEGHGALLYDQTQMVALIVSKPGVVPAAHVVDTQVRLIDIAPTLYDLAGFPFPKAMDGLTLRPVWEGRERAHRTAYFETFYREEISAGRDDTQPLRPLAGVRLDNRWKVIWEPNGLDARVEVFDLSVDPMEWHPSLTREKPPEPPNFSGERLDVERLSAAATAVGRASPAAAKVLKAVAALFAARPGVGIAINGSLAEDRFDIWSDLDISLTFPLRSPTEQDQVWVKDCVESVGRPLAFFPATHLGMANLFIFFLEIDGSIVKIDVECVGPADRSPEKASVILREPSGGLPSLLLDGLYRFDVELAWNRLIGWSWFCQTKIGRGELFAAEEGIAGIRGLILIPAIRIRNGATMSGTRHLEQIIGEEDLTALAATFPAIMSRPAVATALAAAMHCGADLLTALSEPGIAAGYATRLQCVSRLEDVGGSRG